MAKLHLAIGDTPWRMGVSLVRASARLGARNKGEGFVDHGGWQVKIFYWKVTDNGQKVLRQSQNDGTIGSRGGKVDITGASGAIPRSDVKRMTEHAELYYKEIRNRTSDVAAIAQNTEFSPDDIEKIKRHIFVNRYELHGETPVRFDPDYDMAVSWQRLIDGKNIREMDLVMLRHELMEHRLMTENGLSYQDAHAVAERNYNYAEYVRELNKKEGLL